MIKRSYLAIGLAVIFLILFTVRVNQVGGFNKNLYRFNSATLQDSPESFSRLNQYLTGTISAVLPDPESSLLSGIILGAKQDLPTDFKQALTKTSTIHIVVVSGQNLSILSGFIMVLAPLIGRKKTIVLNLLAIFGFTLLTGFQVPVLRAAIMVTLALSAQILGKEGDSVWILMLTGMIMLLIDPNWLFSVSFQLSFLSTAGVIILSPLVADKLHFLPDLIRQDAGVTIAAQALTWPIIAANFNQFSIIGLLVNILVLWTIPAIMMTGIATLIVSLFSLNLGIILGIVPQILLRYFYDVVTFFSSFSFAQIITPRIAFPVFVGYYLLLVSIFLFLKKQANQLALG